jgi:hypothetical protein
LDYLTTNTSPSPIRHGFAPGFVNYKKGCPRLAVASDKVYQLLVNGRWFPPGTPASSTTKTGRHDIVQLYKQMVMERSKMWKIPTKLTRGKTNVIVVSVTDKMSREQVLEPDLEEEIRVVQ